MTTGWPAAEPDPVQRLRVMAAGLNAVMYAEEYIDAPVTDVWDVAGDLEGELPHLVPTLKAFRLIPDHRPGTPERGRARAYGPFGHTALFDVLLRPGYCLMQSRFVVGGMAAVSEGDGTRFAVLGGLRAGRPAGALNVLRSLGRSRGLLMIARARRRTAARRAR